MILCNNRLSKCVFLTAFEYLHCMFLFCRIVLRKGLEPLSACLFTVHPSLHKTRYGLWQDMQTLFDRLVDVLEAHYLFAHQLIDLRVLDETAPPAVRVNFLRESIPQNDVSLRYFFSGIGKPQAAEWLIPLRDVGYFRHPPAPIFDAHTQTTSLPRWPASQYLVQIAKLAPQEVCGVILDILPSENVHVYADCLDAACQMPAAIAQQLVSSAINWMELSYQWLLPEKAGALIAHLAQGGESDAALQLFAAFLDRFQHLRSTYDPWNYARILRLTLPALLTSAGLRTLVLLANRLGECLSTDETDIAIAYRYSSSRRPMIETIGEERMEEMGGIGHLLISLLRQAAELAIRQGLAPIQEVLALLQTHPSFVFSRLVLYLLSFFPDQAPEAVASVLTNRQLFANTSVRREYVLLLQAAFGHLAQASQETILRWIEDGPGDLAEQRTAYEQYNREPFTDEMATRYHQQWRRDWYARFGPARPPALQQRYTALLEACGPAELPETTYPRFIIGSWVASSPKSVEEFATMGVRELVAFLKTGSPSSQMTRYALPPRFRDCWRRSITPRQQPRCAFLAMVDNKRQMYGRASLSVIRNRSAANYSRITAIIPNITLVPFTTTDLSSVYSE